MVSITVRNVPDAVHRALRVRAAQHGRSAEAEMRAILEQAVNPTQRLRIGEAIAALTYAEQALQQRRNELEAFLESAYARNRMASRQANALQTVVTQAEAALQVAEAAYRFGERGILEVIDAQRTLRTVRLELLNARFDQQSAWIDIERIRATDLGVMK